MTTTKHARHAAPRPRRLRTTTRTGLVAAGALALAPLLGAAPSSASGFSVDPVTLALVDSTPTHMGLSVDPGDGTAPVRQSWTLEGKRTQTLTFGLSGSFSSPPTVLLNGSCRTLIAHLADSAYELIADHAYQPTQQDPATGAPVDYGARKVDKYGHARVADTQNPTVTFTFCR